jgi:50S ribosomal protein L16 3-hydroxylase
MMYDDHHVFINGEAFEASGRDALAMHQLADSRELVAADCRRLSAGAAALLDDWFEAGWVRGAAG